ncbi:DNA-dependent ATPase mgs1 [Umbelopsis sp. WA50703]
MDRDCAVALGEEAAKPVKSSPVKAKAVSNNSPGVDIDTESSSPQAGDNKKAICPFCYRSVAASNIDYHVDNECSGPPETERRSQGSQAGAKRSTISGENSPESKKMRSFLRQTSQDKLEMSNQDTKLIPSTNTSTDLSSTQEPKKRSKQNNVIKAMPLAARIRPSAIEHFVGQEDLMGEKGTLRTFIKNNKLPSMVLWGPPGSGKTTIARLIAKMVSARCIELSATSHGAADVRKAADEAKNHLTMFGQKTIVFLDEIHRFKRDQQDILLPHVEKGTITLIGATTENPSFKLNSALLSRCRVFVLNRLSEDELYQIVARALKVWRSEEGEESDSAEANDEDKEALLQLAKVSDGDARTALNILDMALTLLPYPSSHLTPENVKAAFQRSHLLYDRNAEEHYNIISAMHKSIRGGDADAALYWLGRMLQGGEDPLYVARRLVRAASEDIGLADNTALPLAVAAYQACERLGMPECEVNLAQIVVYLAEARKSIRVYKAYSKVKSAIANEPNLPVPLHIRNAPTKLMKDLHYGEGYKYNPDYDEPVDQEYLPEDLQTKKFLDVD